MKALIPLVLAVVILSPVAAFAGAATDAALGLGAFAVFNQIVSGTGVFGLAPAHTVVVQAPPVYYAPAPASVYVAAPLYAAPPVYVAPRRAYVVPRPGYYVPRPMIIHHHHGHGGHPKHIRHHPHRGHGR